MNSYKILSLLLISALAVVACKKQEQPKEEQVKTTETTPINCDDASVKNSLIKALTSQLGNDVNSVMANYADADTLELSRRTLQRLSEINLDLQDTKLDNTTCQATLVIGIPEVDISYAKKHYSDNNLTPLENRLNSDTLKLANGKISTVISYTVNNNVATLNSTVPALKTISDIMSASAYQMAQDENRVNIAARPAITVRPLEPVRVERPESTQRLEEPSLENDNTTPDTAPAVSEVSPAPNASTTKTNNHSPVEGDAEN